MTTTGGAPPLPRPEQIPAKMRERRQWVAAEKRKRNGKSTKVPIIPRDDPERPGLVRLASTTDPATWGTFEEAYAYAKACGLMIGYVFTEDDPFVGIDKDRCRDPETGELTPDTFILLGRLATYAEASTNGTGIHAIAEATKPGTRCRKQGSDLELYDRARLFVFTGQHIAGTPREPQPRQVEVEALYEDLFPELEDTGPATPPPAEPCSLDDTEIIERARRDPRKGAWFAALYDRGDWKGQGYDSHSESRIPFCSEVFYWVGPDDARVERIYLSSALARTQKPGQWGRERERVLEKAGNRRTWWQGDRPAAPPLRGTVPPVEAEASTPEPTPIYAAPNADPTAELARLRAENTDLRRQLGECSRLRQAVEARAVHLEEQLGEARRELWVVRRGLMNQEAKSLVRPGLGLGWAIREQLERPQDPARDIHVDPELGPMVRLDYHKAGRLVGMSDDGPRKVAKTLAARKDGAGVPALHLKVVKIHGPYFDKRTQQWTEGEHPATFAALPEGQDVVTWFDRQLVPAAPDVDPKTGEPVKHGGDRRCDKHPNAGVIITTITRCAEDNEILKSEVERRGPDGRRTARRVYSGPPPGVLSHPVTQLAEEGGPTAPVVVSLHPQVAEEGADRHARPVEVALRRCENFGCSRRFRADGRRYCCERCEAEALGARSRRIAMGVPGD